jgi:hypothetical protein
MVEKLEVLTTVTEPVAGAETKLAVVFAPEPMKIMGV